MVKKKEKTKHSKSLFEDITWGSVNFNKLLQYLHVSIQKLNQQSEG